MKQLIVAVAFLVATANANAQDAHAPQSQEMNIWYNPALKTNRTTLAHFNLRSVNYPGIIAYTSKSATIELPLNGNSRDADETIAFGNLTAGINADNSKDRFLSVSTAMLALSYALPLDNDNTYLSMGFQGNYSFSKIGSGGYTYFPGQFDKYGALGSAIANDPYQAGYSYGFFTVGAGVSAFHNGGDKQWYIGGSIRHFNHPFTEWNHSVRLQSNYGIQAGYATRFSDVDAVGCYVNVSWQDSTNNHFIGTYYNHNLDDSAKNIFSCGIGYHLRDALVPNIGLTIGGNRFVFYYEFNLPGALFNNYNRRAFSFSYRLNL